MNFSFEKCMLGRSYKAQFSFSYCTENEFSCNNGICVSMDQRCDGRSDCDDSSDEEECILIVPDAGYNKFKIPTSKGKTITILIKFTSFTINLFPS